MPCWECRSCAGTCRLRTQAPRAARPLLGRRPDAVLGGCVLQHTCDRPSRRKIFLGRRFFFNRAGTGASPVSYRRCLSAYCFAPPTEGGRPKARPSPALRRAFLFAAPHVSKRKRSFTLFLRWGAARRPSWTPLLATRWMIRRQNENARRLPGMTFTSHTPGKCVKH